MRKQNTVGTKRNKHMMYVAILLAVCLAACFVAKIGYDVCFQRAEKTENSIHLRYEDTSGYSRTPVTFLSEKNLLHGYIYGEANTRGLVVISHGLRACADSYFAETIFFVDHGWRVFVYDNTGSHESEGESARGISQSLLDLRAALNYAGQNDALRGLPLVLYGHSWGGYAVTAILNDNYDIRGVVSIAGFSTPREALFDFAEGRTGIFGTVGFPLFWGYHSLLFGGQSNISAIDGLNRSNTPVMLVHGTADSTLRYSVSGIIAHQAQITNPNVTYISRDVDGQNGHSNLVYSQQAILYADSKTDEWIALEKQYHGEVPADVTRSFYNHVDRVRASELDASLFGTILSFYENAILPIPQTTGAGCPAPVP